MRSTLGKAIVAVIIVAAAFGAAAIYTAFGIDRIEKAHPPAGRFVDVGSGRLHVVELGRGDAPAVVLLHGASANLEDMRLALGDKLAAQYRVILFDRPGHGWSDRPGGADDALPAQQAKLIHAALEKMDVRRATFVGHSWSGGLVLAYALAYPQDVTGVVLLAPLIYPQQRTVGWYGNIVSALLAQSARTAEAPVVGPFFARTLLYPAGKVLLRLAVRSAFAPQTPPPDYIAKTAAELLLRPAEFISNGEDIAAINGFLESQAPNYPRITAPIAIIAGEADAVVSTDTNAKLLAASAPRARLTVLPGVGHMVHYAAPERVIEAVGEVSR
jgi:pimeloyl-ACP methyl ester carboxylesterase